VSLWANQVNNGQSLTFSKAKFLGIHCDVYTLGGLDRLTPGSRITFAWAVDNGATTNAAVRVPSERKAVNVPRQVLESYVGTYALQSGFDLNVTLDHGRLVVQRTGMPPGVPLLPESDTKFSVQGAAAQIVFVNSEHGPVTHLILSESGHEIRGLRK
jgi:hypothetical protein